MIDQILNVRIEHDNWNIDVRIKYIIVYYQLCYSSQVPFTS